MFLNEQEVADLTGYERTNYQKKWLAENGFTYLEDSNNKPKVLRHAVASRLGGVAIKSRREPTLRLA